MTILYALTGQNVANIDFNPTDNVFGSASITIATQTPYPFGLIHYDETNGGRIVSWPTSTVDPPR